MKPKDEVTVTITNPSGHTLSMLPTGGRYYLVSPPQRLQPGKYTAKLDHENLTATIQPKEKQDAD